MKRFFALILIIFYLSCSEEKVQPQVEQSVTIGEIPANESWNSKTTFTEDGKIRAVLFSNHLKIFAKQKVTLLEGVKIDFYSKDQKKKSFLTSIRGKVDDETKNMYAIDSVVAKNDSGVVLRTNELMWRNKDQKIISDKFVKITSPKEIIEGYGFESDQHLDNYVIFNVTYSSSLPGKQKK